ncbi:MAG: hypothetical protein NZ805_14655 [Armatimonadetes bacterium]|nr:hypothetical protein [Armatimonadota bacterium]
MQKQSWVDKERIGIFGVSFSGFATLSACNSSAPILAMRR